MRSNVRNLIGLLVVISIILVALGSATATTFAQTPVAKKDKYLIGMSQANKGEPWRQAMNDQIAAAAKAHPEFEVVFADAAQNNAKQVADVENFMQQGIDLLIISPNEAAPLTDVVAKAYDKGIPVIVLDRKVLGDKFTMWIGADNTLIGKKAGEYAAQWCKTQNLSPCNVGEIRGLEGATPAKERGDGFRAGIAGNPDVKIIASQNADWLREKAIPVSQAMFAANPNINVLYGHNDPMAEAAIISAQNAKLDLKKMLFIGIDGLPTPDGGIRSVMDGRISVTYVYPTGGAEAIDWATKILEQGVKADKTVVLNTIEVTPANAADLYKQFGGAAPVAKKDKYLIGMSQANKGEPWRQAMNDQIAAAAKAHPEFEVVFADAAQNNAKQVADVENFMQQGIDLLIISPNEAAPLTDVVAKAYDKGIPVIVLDRKVLGDKFTMWIGADNTLIGKKAGEYAAQWCKTQNLSPCNVGEIRGLEGATPAKERGDGFRAGIAGNPDVKIIASQNADWLREKAIPVSQAMFAANPNINVLYGHNDPMAEAAIISAQNAKLDLKKMLFIGIDGLPTPDGGIRSVMDGRISVTYVYPTGGAEAIDWATKILEQGVKADKTVVLNTIEVTPANAADLYKQFGGK